MAAPHSAHGHHPVGDLAAHDLSAFDLADMAACGVRLREAVRSAPTLDAAAQSLADFLHGRLRTDRGARRPDISVHLASGASLGALREFRPHAAGLPDTDPAERATDPAERATDPSTPTEAADGASLAYRLLERVGAGTEHVDDTPALEAGVAVLQVTRTDDAPQPHGGNRRGPASALLFGGPLTGGEWFVVTLACPAELPGEVAELFRPLACGARLALLSAGGAPPGLQAQAAAALADSLDDTVARRAAHLQGAVAELRTTEARLRRSQRELQQRESELREEAAIVELLQEIGSTLAAELDLDALVQRAVDTATRLSGAEFGAFFYNVLGETGESYLLYVISGVDRSEFDKFPMPRNTQVFEQTFRGLGVVRSDDITADPRYGHNAPHHGMPEGHLPVRSYLAVPVISRGTVLGGFFFGHAEPGVFTQRHERLVTGVASQTAVALQNAQSYRQEREAAMALQRHLLPRLPRVDGIVTTSRYLPAARSRGAGGDWVDLIPLRDGEVALVVGDVMGKGVKAAAVMGQIRTACRAYAQLGLTPCEVLEQLSILVDDIAPGSIVTCVYALLDRDRGLLRAAVAGHLPPALRDPHGGVRFLDEQVGPPLGVGRRQYAQTEARVESGARLLLYTDGLVERRGRSIDDGLRQLGELLAGPVGEVEADCDSWLEALADGQHDDDIAMLYLYRPEDPAHHVVSVVRDYPPVSGAVPEARDLAARTMRAWGLPHLANDLMLITDELVANAVRHARTAMRVELRRSGGRVVLEVTDSSTEEPRLIVSNPGEFGHRGIFLVDALATRWGTRSIDGGKVVWVEVATA
ncbi:ATP-binding SpoIIE family protein phosphatase [Streptomyces djakartensis]|uniref:ATP-binding SpoIIE family protein phosphatase n=1 Tax=Streptomyces djakartensis TaxID=68193 RepID=UPI0034DDFE1C